MLSKQWPKIQERVGKESEVKTKLLSLLAFKPLEQYNKMPDWPSCQHIDLMLDNGTQWPRLEDREVIIHAIVGRLAHWGAVPLDVCVVRNSNQFALVVKTAE